MTHKVQYTYPKTVPHERTKHIDVRLHFVRDIISQGQVSVEKIPIEVNHVDMLTKPIPVAKFEQAISLLRLVAV